MADVVDDDSEGSRGKRNDVGGGASPAESEAESSPLQEKEAPAASTSGGRGDAFLDAVKGVSDAVSVEDDQYAPAPPSTSTSSAAAAAAAAAPPKSPPAPSLSRRKTNSEVSAAAVGDDEAKKASAAEAAAAAKRAADAERRKELAAQLEQLSETLKLYEREHDFFFTGLSGFGVLIGLGVFASSWLAGLSGSLSLSTDSKSRALQIVIAAAGLLGGLLSTAQRVWSPAVRSMAYKQARDDYARLRKKCKVALGGNNDGSGEASLAALESAVRSISAKAGTRVFSFLSSFFLSVIILLSHFSSARRRGRREKERERAEKGFVSSVLSFFLRPRTTNPEISRPRPRQKQKNRRPLRALPGHPHRRRRLHGRARSPLLQHPAGLRGGLLPLRGVLLPRGPEEARRRARRRRGRQGRLGLIRLRSDERKRIGG